MNAIKTIDRVDYLGGATFVTNENAQTNRGVSIGNFMNIEITGQINNNFTDYVTRTPLYMHEYGHYIDSQIFGLTYIFNIGIPSLISAGISSQIDGEPQGVTQHDFRWYEMSANKNAARYFGKHYGVNWDNNEVRFPRRTR
ncbi:hypothetical protein [Capnocytophaga sp.]|uniref:hypothetical protein n=1 Tax=Capnocytophaga sp. TaxID=44737 RepID=UPI0026DC963E|nr:hypothetical protein [Capnocytophaga sp.]MDO5104976.1 hypothetical protein [Capnocytophaga sp.]